MSFTSSQIVSETDISGVITSAIATTGTTTFTAVLKDNKTGLARTPQATTLLWDLDKDNSNHEQILMSSHTTASGVTTFTINTSTGRNIPKYGTGNGSATGLAHSIGATIGCVTSARPLNIIASEGVAKSGDTMTGPIDFTGTTHAGVKMISLTTAQRNALTAANGMIVYDSDIGEHYQYIAGAWSAVSSGSTQPNASTTVAGKVEEATTTEMGAGTATGATGARLFVNSGNLVKTSSGAADENKIPVLDANGEFAYGFISGHKRSFTTGENIATADAVRIKEDGKIYKAEKFPRVYPNPIEYTAENSDSTYKCACSIATNKVVYIYNVGNTTHAVVATWDGDRPTWGSPVNITATNAGWTTPGEVDVCKVDTDKFAVVQWADTDPNVDDGQICICTVSGTTITVGTAVTFENGPQIATSVNRVCSPATDVVAIVWEDKATNSQCNARVATVSGTVPTFGAEVVIDTTTGAGTACDITDIDTNKFVAVHYGSGADLYATVGTISGNTITAGADTELVDAITVHAFVRVAKVDTNKFVVLYYASAPTAGTYMLCCTVSGTTITAGTPMLVSSFDGYNNQILPLSTNRCVMAFQEQVSGSQTPYYTYKVDIVSFTGTVPTVYKIGETLYAVQSDPTNIGSSVFKDLVDINGDQFQIYLNENTGKDPFLYNFADNNFIGWADETIASGNPCKVNLYIDDNQSSLVTGALYYLGANGVLSLTGNVPAGTAISATEILKQ